MNIIRLNAAHVSEYRDLMLEAFEKAPDAFVATVEERAAEPDSWWARRLDDPGGNTASFGAYADDALVGTVAVEFSNRPKTRHKACLLGMYVKPAARRAGVGHALLQEALAHSEARPELRVITLTVTEGNASALRLYEAAGFKPFGVEPMAIRQDSGYRSRVHMWRSVGGGEL